MCRTGITKITSLQKGIKSLSRYSLVHKFIPKPQALNIPVAKAAVENNAKIAENTRMAADKSQKQERSDR